MEESGSSVDGLVAEEKPPVQQLLDAFNEKKMPLLPSSDFFSFFHLFW